jgi:hypothetical protein
VLVKYKTLVSHFYEEIYYDCKNKVVSLLLGEPWPALLLYPVDCLRFIENTMFLRALNGKNNLPSNEQGAVAVTL